MEVYYRIAEQDAVVQKVLGLDRGVHIPKITMKLKAELVWEPDHLLFTAKQLHIKWV